MEAAPRLPMLCFILKQSPGNTDFDHPLETSIRLFYGEDPQKFTREIREIDQLRKNAIHPTKDFVGCSVLKKYYAQLISLENRFPRMWDQSGRDEEMRRDVLAFMWQDIYSNRVFNISDIKYEQACILYNIGALHSQLGSAESRQDSDGMRVACTHFQCAAWAFQTLRDKYAQPKGSDMCHDLMTLFVNICLAQSQECILEKSMLDGRKSSITAKVSAQIVEYYRVASSQLGPNDVVSEVVGAKLCKSWKRFMEFKANYYGAISALHMGIQAEETQKMGERVAWYELAEKRLQEATANVKDTDKEGFVEAVQFTNDVISGKLQAAKKENDFVYHEKVPPTLPEVKGANLVKGTAFDPTDPEISGPEIFGRLVPLEAHETSSMYSEEKAKLLRTIAEKVEEKDSALATFLSKMNLDKSVLELDQLDNVPREVVERALHVHQNPEMMPKLANTIKALSESYGELQHLLRTARQMLNDELEKVAEHQKAFARKAPANILAEIKAELERYETAEKNASESHKTIHEAYNAQLPYLNILAGPLGNLEREIPPVLESVTDEDRQHAAELSKIIDKVDEMKQQRFMLHQQLREDVLNDDITKLIVARKARADDTNLESFFAEAMEKHQGEISILEQNLNAQQKVLDALRNAYADFGDVRAAIMRGTERRESVIQSIIISFDAYEKLLSKATLGLEYFQELKGNLQKLVTRLKSVSSVQSEEREQFVQAQAKKAMTATSMQPILSSSGGPPKLKDYLNAMKAGEIPDITSAMGVRPTPLGSEQTVAISQCTSQQPTFTTPISGSLSNNPTPSPYPSPMNVQQLNPSSMAAYQQQMLNNRTASVAATSSFGQQPLPGGYTATTASLQMQHPSSQPPQFSQTPALQQHYMAQPQVSQMQTLPGQVSQLHSVPVTGTGYQASQLPQQPMLSQYQQQFQQPVFTATVQQPNSQVAQQTPSPVVSYQQPNVPVSNQTYQPRPQVNAYGQQMSMQVPCTQQAVAGISYGNQMPQQAVSSQQSFATLQQPGGMQVPQSQQLNMQQLPQQPMQQFQNATVSQPLGVQQSMGMSQLAGNVIQSTISQIMPQSSGISGFSHSLPGITMAQVGVPPAMTQGQPLGLQYGIGYNGVSGGSMASPYTPPMFPGMFSGSVATYTNRTSLMTCANSNSSTQSGYQTGQQGYSPQQLLIAATSAAFQTPSGVPISARSGAEYGQLPPSGRFNSSVTYSQPAYQYQYASQPSIVNPSTPTPNNWQPMQPNGLGQQSVINGTQIHNQQQPLQAQNYVQNPTSSALLQQQSQQVASTSNWNQTSIMNDSSDPFKMLDTVLPTQVPLQPEPIVSTTGNSAATPSMAIPNRLTHSNTPAGNDLLSTTPERASTMPKDVLEPKPISMEDLLSSVSHKEKPAPIPQKDPLSDPENLSRFKTDVEKLEKTVDCLTKRSLNGPTPLEQKWKELQDGESSTSRISVARCCPMKNRFPDIMPYDHNRVELKSTRDDYINASMIRNLSNGGPSYIVTQAPLPLTYADFWMMIWEQQVETIVCLLNIPELKGHVYFPEHKNESLSLTPFTVALQSTKTKPYGVERIVLITHTEAKSTRTVVHLQFTDWAQAQSGALQSLLQFVADAHSLHRLQRSRQTPVVVHCLGGAGRSGMWCAISAAASEMAINGLCPDVMSIVGTLLRARKFVVQDREQLKFIFEAILYHAQDLLVKCGILATGSSSLSGARGHKRHPSLDFVQGTTSVVPATSLDVDKYLDELTHEQAPNTTAPNVSLTATPMEHSGDEDQTRISGDGMSSVEDENPEKPMKSGLLDDLLDPATFTLPPTAPSSKASKITRDSFNNAGAAMGSSTTSEDDPLSQLDPLWSLRKT